MIIYNGMKLSVPTTNQNSVSYNSEQITANTDQQTPNQPLKLHSSRNLFQGTKLYNTEDALGVRVFFFPVQETFQIYRLESGPY